MDKHSREQRMEILIGRYIDGTIEARQSQELLDFLRERPEWGKIVREQIQIDVDLRNTDAMEEFFLEPMPFSLPIPGSGIEKNGKSGFFPRKWIVSGGLAMIFLLGIVLFFERHASKDFATITQTTNCLWADSLTRTSPGTRLGPCTLRLEQGIALVHFDCGVVVSLEGPSVFEITHEKRVFFHSGRLVATVETSDGKGFIVETPENRIVDHGTKFGVYVPEGNLSEVYVLEGVVEVFPKTDAGSTVFLKDGQSVISGFQNANVVEAPRSSVSFNTATGRGKEAWAIQDVQVIEEAERLFPDGVQEIFMLVKTSTENDPKSDRKAIFSIDISSLDRDAKSGVADVSLDIAFAPTGIGYASNVPDSQFTVYGLIDETWDDWEEGTLDWTNFPGNAPRSELQSTVWQPLGTFSIAQGSPFGIRKIQDGRLTDFVRRDTNGLLTFAVVRDTAALERYGLVHGFANRKHPTLQPPRLQIQTLPPK